MFLHNNSYLLGPSRNDPENLAMQMLFLTNLARLNTSINYRNKPIFNLKRSNDLMSCLRTDSYYGCLMLQITIDRVHANSNVIGKLLK